MTPIDRPPYSVEETAIIRKRQAARARVMGLALVGLCVLFFLITSRTGTSEFFIFFLITIVKVGGAN